MDLKKTARQLVAPQKGILAADESLGTIEKRLKSVGVKSTTENRRKYREILLTTPEIEKYISGVILFDETLRLVSLASLDVARDKQGKSAAKILEEKGIMPGIKVDQGKVEMANFKGESITEGLDGLADRLQEYKKLGARFAKWRAVITIGPNIPSQTCIESNAHVLARYAAICQNEGFVPIVEPEVVMDGDHSMERCGQVTSAVLTNVFFHLLEQKVDLEAVLLKTNMILPGKESRERPTAKQVAELTVTVLERSVPEEVAGIVFLSGGQSPVEATERLNEINLAANGVPWELSFSFARGLQEPVLETWRGREANVLQAKREFVKRAKLNSLARQGKYLKKMEEGVYGSS